MLSTTLCLPVSKFRSSAKYVGELKVLKYFECIRFQSVRVGAIQWNLLGPLTLYISNKWTDGDGAM